MLIKRQDEIYFFFLSLSHSLAVQQIGDEENDRSHRKTHGCRLCISLNQISLTMSPLLLLSYSFEELRKKK